MKDLGKLKYFLAIKFVNMKDYLWILEHKYYLDILEDLDMADCKSIFTPLEQNVKFLKKKDVR